MNIKIILLNNSRLGIVSQFQIITFGKDQLQKSLKHLIFILSKAFDIKYCKITNNREINQKISKIDKF